MTDPPPSFHLVAKPTGAACNLDCAYCFFLEKEQLYPGKRTRMTDATLERYIRQLIEAHQTPEVTIAWQGGEPMLMGARVLPPGRGAREATRAAPHDCAAHHPDQRHQGRRRLGPVLR